VRPNNAAFNCPTMVRTLASILALLAVCTVVAVAAENPATEAVRRLARGINLGNALEAPAEGAWGVTLRSEYFDIIKDAGFTSVRIPVRWSAHAQAEAPYAIAPEFFARVDFVVRGALSRGLNVVIDDHHYAELFQNPQRELPRLIALWDQIASHYRDYSQDVFFELLNEPQGEMTDDVWQEVMLKLLRTVRRTNHDRMVIVGPGHLNGLDHLANLRLPDEDTRLIATFHYYRPMSFTHQMASWVKGSELWKGTVWAGTADQRQAVKSDFDEAAQWARANRRPLYVGEFGAYGAADIESRVRWTAAVVQEAERHGFGWAYWEFNAGFGAYDTEAQAWREDLLNALIARPPVKK
jgi:endoglucanase